MSDIREAVATIYEYILPGRQMNNPHIVGNLLAILIDLHEHLTRIEEALDKGGLHVEGGSP